MRQQHHRRFLRTTFKPIHTQLLHTSTKGNNNDHSKAVKEDYGNESQEYIFADESEIIDEPLNDDEELDDNDVYCEKYSYRTSLSDVNMNNTNEAMVSHDSDETEESHELSTVLRSPNNLLLKLATLIRATNMNKKNTNQLLQIVRDVSNL